MLIQPVVCFYDSTGLSAMVRRPPCPVSSWLQEQILTSSEMDDDWGSEEGSCSIYLFISIIQWD